jgi:hypothetical protein
MSRSVDGEPRTSPRMLAGELRRLSAVHGRILARVGRVSVLGRGALERAFSEHVPALGADRALDLVRDAEPLQQHVRTNCRVRVSAPAERGKELGHRPRTQRSDGIGNYDAQKGDEVVTNRCRRRGRAGATLAFVNHPRSVLLVSLPLACVLAACGATTGRGSTALPPTAAAPHCRPGLSPLGSKRLAVAADVPRHARVYRWPGRKPFASFGRLNQNDFPTVFRVLAALRRRNCKASWYRVQLPLRPNGVTGFVPARDVELGTVRTRVVVRVSRKRLTLYRAGKRVLTTTVAVGSSATPTPTGSYYVNQRLVPTDPSGPFGPGAIGISAFSNVLTGWAQGGPIAIHGTNEPWSIGHAVSNGCIRVHNDVLRRLFKSTPAGTPVVILR